MCVSVENPHYKEEPKKKENLQRWEVFTSQLIPRRFDEMLINLGTNNCAIKEQLVTFLRHFPVRRDRQRNYEWLCVSFETKIPFDRGYSFFVVDKRSALLIYWRRREKRLDK